jgi:hypothetical protein
MMRLLTGGNRVFCTTKGPTAEPVVLLWIYGGKVINKKTNVEALFSLFQL